MTHTREESYAASLEYFGGDELAASVFVDKYALKDLQGNLLERTPADMHRRLAKEFARIEAKYPNPMSEEEIFGYLNDWSIVPQGSPMSAIGNPYQYQSLSNCFVIQSPYDSYAGILKAD
jgi:ribonucleoside-diphosphate reductase alpha chain